jgi:hypothetical protein
MVLNPYVDRTEREHAVVFRSELGQGSVPEPSLWACAQAMNDLLSEPE